MLEGSPTMNAKLMSALLVLVASSAGSISAAAASTGANIDIPRWPPPYVDDWPVKTMAGDRIICDDTILYYRMPDECLRLDGQTALIENDDPLDWPRKPKGNIKLPELAAAEAPVVVEVAAVTRECSVEVKADNAGNQSATMGCKITF